MLIYILGRYIEIFFSKYVTKNLVIVSQCILVILDIFSFDKMCVTFFFFGGGGKFWCDFSLKKYFKHKRNSILIQLGLTASLKKV